MPLRKIEPIPFPDLMPRSENFGARPEVQWVAPGSLYVDSTYQRDMSKRSIKVIYQTMRNFAWNRLKPPIVVMADGCLQVVDGQHTAIAAATLNIPEIPVFLVEAASLDERARAFVGHNTDRVSVTPTQIYRALVAAGDPDALDVEAVCRRAGVRMRQMSNHTTPNVGDTMAIGTLRSLVKRRGVILARKVLEVLVKAKRAPVLVEEIVAADFLVCSQKVDPDKLAVAVRVEGDDALASAKSRARIERIPTWRALADKWASRLAKRRIAA